MERRNSFRVLLYLESKFISLEFPKTAKSYVIALYYLDFYVNSNHILSFDVLSQIVKNRPEINLKDELQKHVTSGGVHLRSLAPGQHSFKLRRTITTVARLLETLCPIRPARG